jgi:hydrogenase small subunit
MSEVKTVYGLRRQGIPSRSFRKDRTLTASALGLGPAFVPKIAEGMETKPRTPVVWVHGPDCTCCFESVMRAAHPLDEDGMFCISGGRPVVERLRYAAKGAKALMP